MKITLKDGSVKEYAQAMSVIDIAKDLSEGLARVACAGEVDGEVVDLRTVLEQDCELNILTAKDEKGLAALRHTASHVRAQAVKRLYPNTKLAKAPTAIMFIPSLPALELMVARINSKASKKVEPVAALAGKIVP